MSKTKTLIVSTALLCCMVTGCSKKQIVPGILTGTGAATLTTGVIYRASLDDADHLFGDTSKEKAIVATLTLTGLALITTGVILAATTPLCESSEDCFTGDTCDSKSKTCVPKTLKRLPPNPDQAATFFNPLAQDPLDLQISTDTPSAL